jgi:4-amino-4-deoxy-L-arabinose transferase-like glycosyltransferase
MVYGTARKLYNRQAGLLAAMCLGTFGLYSAMAHMVTLDLTLATFVSGSLCAFLLGQHSAAGPARSRWMLAMYFCAAMATLTKGLPGMIVFSWLLLTWQWSELKTYCIPSGFVLLCVLVLPWHILVQLKHPEFFRYYVIDQQFLRYLTDLSKRHQPFWFIPTVLIGGLFPWMGFMVPAVISAWPKQWRQNNRGKNLETLSINNHNSRINRDNNPEIRSTHDSNSLIIKGISRSILTLSAKKDQAYYNLIHLFLLLWAGLIFLFFWKSNSQLIPYVLPIYPPLAILLGRYLDQVLGSSPQNRTHWGITFGLGTAFISSGILIAVGSTKLDLSEPSMIISLVLLSITALLPCLVRWRSSVLASLISLSVCASVFFISINFSYPPTDTRSVKSLALTLKPLIQKNDLIYSYQNYYQDLAVYLGRRVIIVDYYGELWHGIEHNDNPGQWLSLKEFWLRWSKPSRQFMILNINDYEAIQKEHRHQLYEIARNQHNILVSNFKDWAEAPIPHRYR